MSAGQQVEPGGLPAPDRRLRQVEELQGAMRERASRTLMFHQAITDLMGLGPTDVKALDLARHEPHLTAGRLARITGLSTSATTAVLDRLEGKGFVERRRDPADRRKVVVVATGRHDAELTEAFAEVAAATEELYRGYDADQLQLLIDFTRRMNELSEKLTRSVTERGRRAPGRGG